MTIAEGLAFSQAGNEQLCRAAGILGDGIEGFISGATALNIGHGDLHLALRAGDATFVLLDIAQPYLHTLTDQPESWPPACRRCRETRRWREASAFFHVAP